jgi:hypothetical protein
MKTEPEEREGIKIKGFLKEAFETPNHKILI